MRKRRHLDDWDPTNPFHIHTEDGQKVVFTKEAYDKLPDNIKQQIDAHYKEMNTFENKYQTTEEYKDFLQKVANSRVADDVKASIQEKYLDKNWYDENWKNGAYSFDDRGLMTYNGQTYAPFGDSSKEGIVVPLRDTSGSSYGHNVVYYPYTIPEQYAERQPEPVNSTIEEKVIDDVTNKAINDYITNNTKYYTPYLNDLFYDSDSKHLISKEAYKTKYPYKGVYKVDRASGTKLYGDVNNNPYLTEKEFIEGVQTIINKLNQDTYNIHKKREGLSYKDFYRKYPFWFETVQSYINDYPDEYKNRVAPSEQEAIENINITIADLIEAQNNQHKEKRSLKNGGIYIKPSHRGRFTALKERTGHSSTWFKENGTPAQKKMATFALNAAKWKH